MSWTQVLLMVPAEHVELANKIGAVFDPDTGGNHTFGPCGLSPDGQAPATHYLASTLIRPAYLPAFDSVDHMYGALSQLAQEYGREAPSYEECQQFQSVLAISQQSVEAFLAAQGLRRASPGMGA